MEVALIDHASDPLTSYDRMLARIPQDIKRVLTSEQLSTLIRAMQVRSTDHMMAFRTSVCIGRGRFYLTCFVGRERRNIERLRNEGQRDLMEISIVYCLLAAVVVLYGIVPILLILYLLKSALGIDIFEGPSPFHSLFCG